MMLVTNNSDLAKPRIPRLVLGVIFLRGMLGLMLPIIPILGLTGIFSLGGTLIALSGVAFSIFASLIVPSIISAMPVHVG